MINRTPTINNTPAINRTSNFRGPLFRDPVFRSLASFASEFDRACASPALGSALGSVRAAGRSAVPAINILGTETELVIEADMPGLSLEDIEIVLSADELTIRGERRFETPEHATLLRQERPGGSFERSFTLPAEINTENATASLDHGVLTITLPKSQASRPRRLEITGSGATPSGSSLPNNSEVASAN
ncbi:MAG: Hsp20/alpha crystallin family protein [Phycisphaerales bacterium]